jgi:plasmid stabilization system protein ParE
VAYRVDLTDRAARDLRRIHDLINAADSAQAAIWFNGLEQAILSLATHPSRGGVVAREQGVLCRKNFHNLSILPADTPNQSG